MNQQSSTDYSRLISEVAHGGLKTREQAASALLSRQAERLVPLLLDTIEDRDYAERNAAIELLGRLGIDCWTVLSQQVDKLSVEGKMFVAPAIAEFRSLQTLPVLHAWATSDDPNLSATACEALGDLGALESIPVLKRVAAEDIWMAGPAISALGDIGKAEVVPILGRLVDDEDLRPFAVSALAKVRHPDAWPLLCEGVADDESLAGIALDDAETLLKSVPVKEIQQHASPKNIWIFAAREGLKRAESRISSAILLGALGDDGSAQRLIDLYLFDVDDDDLRDAIYRLPSSKEILNPDETHRLGDEATRRFVSLLSGLTDMPANQMVQFLTHASPMVRLETTLALKPETNRYVELFGGLLSDPDELVRKTVLQSLRGHWQDATIAQRLADAIDANALPNDIVSILVQDAPQPIPDRIRAYLDQLGDKKAKNQEALHLLLDIRSKPQKAAAQLKKRRRKIDLNTDEITAMLRIEDSDVTDVLLELLRHPSSSTRYVAAEVLAAHPKTTQTIIENALRAASDPGVVAALVSFRGYSDGTTFAHAISAIRCEYDPVTEFEILRALTAADPTAHAKRFRQALEADHWYLQAQAYRGLRAGATGGSAAPETPTSPLAQESLGLNS